MIELEQQTVTEKPLVVSAGFLLEDIYDKKFLLVRPNGGTTGGWGIPKGKRDPGETIYQAAVREYKEETNLDIQDHKVLDRYHIVADMEPFFHYTVDTNDKKRNKRYNKHVYAFHVKAWLTGIQEFPFSCPSLLENGSPEIGEYGWFTLEECYEKVVKSQRGMFEFLVNYKKHNEGLH